MENIQNLHQKILILAFGTHPQKNSLLTRFAHQNKFKYIALDNTSDPILQIIHQQQELKNTNIIINNIPRSLESFIQLEKVLKTYKTIVLYFKDEANQSESEQAIVKFYQKLGIVKILSLKGINIQQNYKQLKKKILNKVIFVYGAPRSGKTQLSKQIANALGYRYVYFNDLKNQLGDEVNQINLINKLIKYLSITNQHLVIDGFFRTKTPLSILFQYVAPSRILHIQSSNDEIQTQLQGIKDLKLKNSKINQFEEYLDNKDDIIGALKSKPYFQNIRFQEARNLIQSLKPSILYMKIENKQFIDQVAAVWEGTHINIMDAINASSQRERKQIDGNNIDAKIEYLKELISNSNGKIILSGFSNNLSDFIKVEQQIGQILYYFLFNQNQITFSQVVTPQMHYLGQQKLIKLDNSNLSSSLVLSYLDSKNPYLILSGPQCSGKTEIAKIIARDYGYKHIQFEPYITQFKETFPSQDGEGPSNSQIISHFKSLVAEGKDKYIFEGIPYEGKDFVEWIKEVGCPTSINLRVDNDNWLNRYRKKNEIDLEGQTTEQDQEKITTAQEKNATYIKNMQQIYEKYPNIKLFQFDCNASLISLQNFLPLILRPRIYLVAENKQVPQILFLNIALKYNMSIFDLSKTNLRDVSVLLKKRSIQRDIILYNYSSQQNFVSDDVYYIEKNLGSIRFVCVWKQQQKQINDPKMVLERPVVESKKKSQIEGQEDGEGAEAQEQQAPVEEQELDQNGEPIKPKIDIYNFQWSETGVSKNLTQWFIHSKKPIKQYVFQQSNVNQVFEDFQLIIGDLNRDRSINIYTVII